MSYFFTADQHYNHSNIIRYCDRPFSSTQEMNEELIRRHNEVVGKNDITIHAGDFAWVKTHKEANSIFKQLNGNHIYLKGCHDRWMPKNTRVMWQKKIENNYVVVCHYPMRSWPRNAHGSIMLHGHCHGTIKPFERQWDVGVDNNDYYPISLEEIIEIIKEKNNE